MALDLDETLVHSSFQPVDNASFVISVVIEGVVHNVFVIKRPGVDEFLERLVKHYEVSESMIHDMVRNVTNRAFPC